MDKLIIKGARENNLKNISLELPKNKLVVLTGLSGSGKSSLAFDTIFKEGERRFIESLSPYARQFLGGSEKPDVDSIEGLSPAISIDQKSTSKNPRSTVGTVTEVYDFLRLLFAKIGVPYCPNHHIPIHGDTKEEMVKKVLALKEGSKVWVMAPVIMHSKGEHKAVFEKYLHEGFIRARVDGEIVSLEDEIKLDKNKEHDIDIVVSRFVMKDGIRDRVSEALEIALKFSGGFVKVMYDDNELFLSEHYACKECGFTMPKIEPRLFSFNSPLGACPECNGLGHCLEVSEDLVVDPDKSIEDGAILPYKNQEKDNLTNAELKQTCEHYKIDMKAKFVDLPLKQRKIVLYGSPDKIDFKMKSSSGRVHDKIDYYEGVITNFRRRYLETNSDWIRDWIETYMVECECQTCHGARLNKAVLSILIDGKSIDDLCQMSIEDLYKFFDTIKLSKTDEQIAHQCIKEIKDRLHFLENVGLEYLTLARGADTLSGGEAQRIRLATQIGSQLTGVLYVLDEPSIGLHQRDNQRLIDTLKEMRDLGNTLIVVEHDSDTMLQSDYLVDIGPGAGDLGGEVVAAGTPSEVMANPNSITGLYLSGKKKIELPKERYKGNGKFIEIKGAEAHNLKKVNAKIPLGTLTLVTGVSGSGKSSLVNEVLYKNLYVKLYKAKKVYPGKCKEIKGLENIDRVIQISQSPIGRTPRSNPATYTGVFDDIRDLFSQTNVAKMRGYDKGRFSFNIKGGRCESCWGDGVKRISMQFLPDVYVPCEACNGTRYNSETLDCTFKGKNIAEVLDMTVKEAYEFFDTIPKIKSKLQTMLDVGLGYIKLGQSSTTLSGGEAQRVKLAYELHSKITPKTLYVMDEPTTGLHIDDIDRLMKVILRMRNQGATIVIIEHNLDVIKLADYIIDIGPEGGCRGGEILYQGAPEGLAKNELSYTGKYLKEYLK